MPTNVTVEYARAEQEYQKASTTQEKIACLEEMLSTAPSHKGAEKLRQEIKTKLAKLRGQLKKEAKQQAKAKSVTIKKEGAAQIVIVGPPNSGKSLLLAKLTSAKPEIHEYPFSTTMPEVGMMDYSSVPLQVVEMPAIVKDSAFKGKGPQFLAIVRNADLVLIATDTPDLGEMFTELRRANIRLNEQQPPITIKRTGKGIEFVGQELITSDIEQVKRLIRNAGIHNAIVQVFAKAGIKEFADAVNDSLAYLPALIALTKGDIKTEGELQQLEEEYPSIPVIPVSALKEKNLDRLKEAVWRTLRLIRVYTKEPGRKAKMDEPVTLTERKSTIRDMAEYIHKDFIKKFRFARIWGTSAKYDGVSVGLDHQLADQDIVELHMR